MTLATINGNLIVRGGLIAERCECCPCRTKWSQAQSIEVEIETLSDYRETVFCLDPNRGYTYATQQFCQDKYTGTFSLTKIGAAVVGSFTNPPLVQTTWNYNFGNQTSFTLRATDDWDGGPNSTWVNLSWSISMATLVSWKLFNDVQSNPYPSESDLCDDPSITPDTFQVPSLGFPGPSETKYAAPAQERFLSTLVQPPSPLELNSVNRICLAGPQVTFATSLVGGGVSETVTDATIYEIWQNSLMGDLASSGQFNACDRFNLSGNCVQQLQQSPAGFYGFRKIGTFQVKAINFTF
jgi:hypothetical protein